MMRRLLTKELKEKRMWIALLLVVLCAGTFLGLYALLFAGWVGWRMWEEQAMMPFVFLGLIAGLAAYSSELSRGRADFLMSRPVSWKKLLAAKVIAAIIGIVAAAALAGLAYWLALPSEFRAAVPLTRIGAGVVFLTVYCSIGYFVGMVFSNVLPGVFGSALVLALVYFCGMSTVMSFDIHKSKTLFWPGLAWVLAPIAATLVIARFGMTLQPMERLRRYGLACLIVVAIIAPLGFFISWPQELNDSYGDSRWVSSQTWEDIQRRFANRVFPSDQLEPMFEQYFYDCRVSPDGSYAVYRQSSPENGMMIVNLATGKARVENGLGKRGGPGYYSTWLSNSSILIPQRKSLCIASVDANCTVKARIIAIPMAQDQKVSVYWLSPDKQAALIRTTLDEEAASKRPPSEGVRASDRIYILVDIPSGRSQTSARKRPFFSTGVLSKNERDWAEWVWTYRPDLHVATDAQRILPPPESR